MNWLRSLYRSETDSAKCREAVRAVDGGRPGAFAGWVLLILSSAPAGQVELVTAREAVGCLPYFGTMTVLGLASDRAGALELLRRLTADCLAETGGAALKSWLTGMPPERFGPAREVLL